MNNEEITHESSDKKPAVFSPLIIVALGVAFVLLLLVVMTQNPGSGGPLVILLFLSLVFLLLFLMVTLLIRLLNRLVSGTAFSPTRTLYTSIAVATGLVYMIGLRTLGQLQVIDVVLVVVFELVLNFYLLRRF